MLLAGCGRSERRRAADDEERQCAAERTDGYAERSDGLCAGTWCHGRVGRMGGGSQDSWRSDRLIGGSESGRRSGELGGSAGGR